MREGDTHFVNRSGLNRNKQSGNIAIVTRGSIDQALGRQPSVQCREANRTDGVHEVLPSAVFFHERSEIRDRSFESQAFRASGLNLVVSAIVHWNTVYIERAVTHLRKMRREIPDHLLKHISPLSWEHINLTGIYTWDSDQHLPEGFRSLRLPVGLLRAA